MTDRADRPFLAERRVVIARAALSLERHEVLHDAGFLVIRFLDEKAVVLNLRRRIRFHAVNLLRAQGRRDKDRDEWQ